MTGIGARTQAMGRSAAAIVDDSEALFWNPARLGWLQRADLSLYKASLYGDETSHNAAYLAWPTLDLGTFAVGIQRMGVNDIERRDDRNFLMGFFGSSETHVLVGAGRRFGSQFGLGASLRFLQQRVDDADDLSIGLDLAGAWQRALDERGLHGISLGINIQNLIEPSIRLDEVSVRDPRSLKLGLGYEGRVSSEKVGWVIGADLDLPADTDSRFGAGAEFDLNHTFFLRGGIDAGRPTFGLGLEIHSLRFSYALWSEEDLGHRNYFTLGFQFGASVDERREQHSEQRRAEVEQRLDELLFTREREAYERSRELADQYYDRAEWSAAADAYRRALALYPDDEFAQERVDEAELALARETAEKAHAAGDLARASVLYQTLLEAWPEDMASRRELAQVRAELTQAEDKERQLSELFQLGVELFSEGDLLGSRAVLDELLRIDPENEMARELRSRGEALRVARGEEALDDARRAARRSRWSNARHSLAQAQVLLPEREAEFAELLRDLEGQEASQLAEASLEREASESRSEFGSIEADRGASLTTAERQALEASFQVGLGYFEAGEFDAAIRTWQSIWDQAPQFGNVGDYLVKAYLLQGINLYSQGEYRQAISRCRRVLDIDPANQKARRYLARIEEEQQELEEIRGE